MPKHEFGIMKCAPAKGKIFEKYEPLKYNCISVDDEYILPLLKPLSNERFYWHTVDVTGKGLAYYGITLISPKSAEVLRNLTANTVELSELTQLLNFAIEHSYFVIHFGI